MNMARQSTSMTTELQDSTHNMTNKDNNDKTKQQADAVLTSLHSAAANDLPGFRTKVKCKTRKWSTGQGSLHVTSVSIGNKRTHNTCSADWRRDTTMSSSFSSDKKLQSDTRDSSQETRFTCHWGMAGSSSSLAALLSVAWHSCFGGARRRCPHL